MNEQVIHRSDGSLARRNERGSIPLKRKRPLLKGGAEDRIRDSKIVNALIGEKEDPVPLDVRRANADVLASTYRAQIHNTDETEGTKGMRFWRRKGKEVKPNIERVYPKFEEWWRGFAERMMKLYPPETHPFGPGEKSPIYFKWQMARSFYEHGRVQVSKIQEAFTDPEFFNTTMMFIEHEATLKMHALGVRKEFDRIFTSKNVLRADTVGRSRPDMGKLLASGLELDATLAVALGTIVLTAATAGVAIPPALVSMLAGYLGAGAVGMTGFAIFEEMGRDGLRRLFDGLRKNGEIRIFTDTCQTSLQQIQGNAPLADYMRDVYHIDPRQIHINNGAVEFVKGTDSTSWIAMQRDLEGDMRLRELFLVDMVGVDMKRAHALTEQFLTQGYPRPRQGRRPSWLGGSRRVGKGADSMIVNQTGSVYEEDVLKKFAELRQTGAPEIGIRGPTALDQGQAARLQLLYIEAGKRVLESRAQPMFSQALTEISINRRDTDGIEAKQKTIDKKLQEWGRGTKGDDGKIEGEGSRRKEEKKIAEKTKKQAEQLIDGVPAEGGNPARKGLADREKAMSRTNEGGLFKRQERIMGVYTGIAADLRASGFRKNADMVDSLQTEKAIHDAIDAINKAKNTLEKGITAYTHPHGRLYEQAKKDYEQSIKRINTIPTPERYRKSPNLIIEDKKAALEQYEIVSSAIKQEYDARNQHIQKLTDLTASLGTKLKELETAQGELGTTRPERIIISQTPKDMHDAYNRVVASPSTVTSVDLDQYGQTGYGMLELVNKLGAFGIHPSLATVPEDAQERIILAVAEQKAKQIYQQNTGSDKLHTLATGAHSEILAALTAEQLIVLPAGRVMEIMDKVTTTTYSALGGAPNKLNAIRDAQHHETQCYVAREKALQQTIEAQRIVVAGLEKAVQDVDKQCDRRLNQIHLVKKFLEDRGNVYREAMSMSSEESLQRYRNGYSVFIAAPTQMRDEDKWEYSFAERRSKLPRGFQDFLRDVFKYHEIGRGLNGVPIDGVNSEILFDTLIDTLGGANAQEVVVHAIVRAFEPSGPGANGFRAFLLPAPPINPENLSFPKVMNILLYRTNPTRYPRPAEANVVATPQPITNYEMMNIAGNIINIVASKVQGSGV